MTASKVALGVVSAVIVAGVAISTEQYQGQMRLRAENMSLREQAAQATADVQRLSKQLAQSNETPGVANQQLRELMRLRGR